MGQAETVLGQPDFATATNPYTTQSGFRNPTDVASDGNILVVSDTDNNRVLIWKTIPAASNQPADIVLGQADFTTSALGLTSSALRGPQGVWVQGTQLFVADTQNNRVMVWNTIPTSNNQPADFVLGEPNFTTSPPPTTSDLPPTASNLFSPVSVTSDGQRLFVTDLGHNRVLIWNSIPTQNGQAADVVVGQQNMTSELDNGAIPTCVSTGTDADGYPTFAAGCPTICPSTGADSNGTPLYPVRCGMTLSYPRYALSDGQRLFIADGGNDRVLVYNTIPTTNGARADIYLGQTDEFSDQVTSPHKFVSSGRRYSRVGAKHNPHAGGTGLGWNESLRVGSQRSAGVGVHRRELPIFRSTASPTRYSLNTYAIGTVSLTGTITAGDTVTITITPPGATTGTNYAYTGPCFRHVDFDHSESREPDRRDEGRHHSGPQRNCDRGHCVRNTF